MQKLLTTYDCMITEVEEHTRMAEANSAEFGGPGHEIYAIRNSSAARFASRMIKLK